MWDLTVGHHEAIDELMDGLDMAIAAVGKLDAIPNKEPGGMVHQAVGYGKTLKAMKDTLNGLMMAEVELVDVEALWEISFGSTPRNGIVEA